MTVVAKDHVPNFGPYVPIPAVFKKVITCLLVMGSPQLVYF